jgi:hypothetical protein
MAKQYSTTSRIGEERMHSRISDISFPCSDGDHQSQSERIDNYIELKFDELPKEV